MCSRHQQQSACVRLQHRHLIAQRSSMCPRRDCTAAAAAVPPSAAEASAAGEVQAAVDSSQETARAAQALVSQAANQERDGDAIANRQGLVRGT